MGIEALPGFLDPPGASPFHRLNPLTKILLAVVTAIDAIMNAAPGTCSPIASIIIWFELAVP